MDPQTQAERGPAAASGAQLAQTVAREVSSESGQAVVEAAIILPAMIFLLLMAIQLTLLQQARLAVEYAAFTAARAGVVMNMDSSKMHDAAVLAVLPSYGRSDDVTHLSTTFLKFKAEDLILSKVGLPQIKVAILNPTRKDFDNLQQHLNKKEIDFDDVRPQVAPKTLLSLQVRYLFQLKVPFANKMLQAIWLATRIGKNSIGGLSSWSGKDLTGPKLLNDQGPGALPLAQGMAAAKGTDPDGTPGGLNLTALVAVSKGPRPIYFLPVSAWYTMRMQSNPFLKFAELP